MDTLFKVLFLNTIGATVFGAIYFEETIDNFTNKRMLINKNVKSYVPAFLIIAVTTLLILLFMKNWTMYIVNDVTSELVYHPNVNAEQLTDSTKVTLKDSDETGARGDVFGGTIGPLIAWIAAIFTFIAFWAQIIANKEQRSDIQFERFENRFFKFIDYHRENVAQMKYADPMRKDETSAILSKCKCIETSELDDSNIKGNVVEYIEGNRVFRRIADEIRELLIEYKNKSSIKAIGKKEIDIVYNAVFFGAGTQSINLLKRKFPGQDFSFGKFATRSTLYNNSVRHYGGHARRLGHYFRNIYQAVKYVNEQKFLSEKQKYDYIAILRAQMSVYEQEVFFYNSLSDLGEVWEHSIFNIKYPKDVEKQKVFSKLWITKYDFIRNILNDNGNIIIKDHKPNSRDVVINIKDYYPLLNLEREKEFKQIGILPFANNDKKICRYCFNKKYIGYYKGNTSEENEKLREEEYEKINEAFEKGITHEFSCNEEICETKLALRKRKF